MDFSNLRAGIAQLIQASRNILIIFTPWWLYYGLDYNFNTFHGQEKLLQNRDVLLEAWDHIINMHWTVFGVFPIFGRNQRSELNPLYLVHLFLGLFRSIFLAIIGSIPIVCSLYTLYNHLKTGHRPDRSQSFSGNHPRESWFFVNGICTPWNVGNSNRRRIEDLFQRPVTFIYNPTDGVLMDLVECMSGRDSDFISAPAQKVFEQVYKELSNNKIDKVVLICHSQGVIIIQTVLHILEIIQTRATRPLYFPFPEKSYRVLTDLELKKLEVYTFASPATKIRDLNKIYVEHFANYFDAVAQIGVLNSRLQGEENYPARQRRFVNYDRRGHLLNEHYLGYFDKMPYYLKTNRGDFTSKLYGYLNGNSPEVK